MDGVGGKQKTDLLVPFRNQISCSSDFISAKNMNRKVMLILVFDRTWTETVEHAYKTFSVQQIV